MLQLEDIPLFFWQHLQRDLEILATSLGRSVDEAALTVHLVLKQMCTHYTGKVEINDMFHNNWLAKHVTTTNRPHEEIRK